MGGKTLDMLIDSVEEDSQYYELLHTFYQFGKPKGGSLESFTPTFTEFM
jgi:hypothetical protein